MAGIGASEHKREREETGSTRKLTERLTEGSAGAGTIGGQLIDAEDLREPRLKNMLGTALWCFPGCLARSGRSGQRCEARGHVREARG